MAEKKCTKCGYLKPLIEYNKERGGLRAYCKSCHSAASLAWSRANPVRRREIANAFTARRREKLGPPKKGGRTRLYTPEENILKMRGWRRNWNFKNKGRVLAKTRAYQAKKKRALPKWADLKKIEAVYQKASASGLHVDHIVPLQSPIVCGLHCEANLQLLPPAVNISKSNKTWPDMP